MNKTLKYSLIGLGILLLIVGSYFLFFKKKQGPNPDEVQQEIDNLVNWLSGDPPDGKEWLKAIAEKARAQENDLLTQIRIEAEWTVKNKYGLA